jgi:hypothetical protein
MSSSSSSSAAAAASRQAVHGLFRLRILISETYESILEIW